MLLDELREPPQTDRVGSGRRHGVREREHPEQPSAHDVGATSLADGGEDLARDHVGRPCRMAAPGNSPDAQLTVRQRDVLRLIVKGQRMKEIAATLGLSVRTVEVHKYEMMENLDLHSTADSSDTRSIIG